MHCRSSLPPLCVNPRACGQEVCPQAERVEDEISVAEFVGKEVLLVCKGPVPKMDEFV